MKSRIWIDPQGGFNYGGGMNALIFSAYNDELLAEVYIEFSYNRVQDTEELTYQITKIYENTKETESQLYDELNQHGNDLLQSEICEWYDDNGYTEWGI